MKWVVRGGVQGGDMDKESSGSSMKVCQICGVLGDEENRDD